MENYYEILGVNPKATEEQIQETYLVLKGSCQDDAELNRIEEAYERLYPTYERKDYDEFLLLPEFLQKRFLKAQELIEVGEFEEGTKILRGLVKQAPTIKRIRAVLGDTYFRMGELSRGIGVFEKLLEKAPNHPGFSGALGKAYLSKGWYGKAIEVLKKSLEENQSNLALRDLLCEAYIANGEEAQFEALIKEVFKMNLEEAQLPQLYFMKFKGRILQVTLQQEGKREQLLLNELETLAEQIKTHPLKSDYGEMFLALCHLANDECLFKLQLELLELAQSHMKLDRACKQEMVEMYQVARLGEALQQFDADNHLSVEFKQTVEMSLTTDLLDDEIEEVLFEEVCEIFGSDFDLNEKILLEGRLALDYEAYLPQIQYVKQTYPIIYNKAYRLFKNLQSLRGRQKLLMAYKRALEE